MPKFCANLTLLFNEQPFLSRFERAAAAGFKAVECQFPYAWPVRDIKAQLAAHDLDLVLHNLPAGDWDAGERGIACHPGRLAEFRQGVMLGVEYATILGVPRLNCLAGKAPPGIPADTLRRTFIENLRFAARALGRAGIKLLVEPVNTYDVPDFFLHGTAQAMSVLDELGEANAFLQYDVYHAQRMEGELVGTMRKYQQWIDHIQIADNPGRHEPGTGEINWSFIFAELDRQAYAGWVGCEYLPAAGTEAGLAWRERWGA